MLPKVTQLFELPQILPDAAFEPEIFETLAEGNGIKIERIISKGHVTKSEFWYEQNTDEWVMLLQGTAILLFDQDSGEELTLHTGQAILISAYRRHRVIFTSTKPPCVWLAIHANFTNAS